MRIKAICLSATLCAVHPQAFAGQSARLWTLSTSGSLSSVGSSDQDTSSASVALSRMVGESSIGVVFAFSEGTDVLFDDTGVSDRSSAFASAWIVVPVGAVDLDVGFTVGQEDFEGRNSLDEHRHENPGGTEAFLISKVDSLAFSGAISRVFIAGNWDIIPKAGLGWSQSDIVSTFQSAEAAEDVGALSQDQSGATATAGLGLGYVVNDKAYLFTDVTGIFAENGSAVSFTRSSRSNRLNLGSRESPDEENWAEFSIGTSIYATDAVTVSLIGGRTLGREEEETFLSTTVSLSF